MVVAATLLETYLLPIYQSRLLSNVNRTSTLPGFGSLPVVTRDAQALVTEQNHRVLKRKKLEAGSWTSLTLIHSRR